MSGLPWWQTLLLGVVGGTGALGGLGAILGARWSARVGIQGNEVAARADEATAEDRLIGRLEQRLASETERALRAEALLSREREYTEVLRRHIWEHGGWPPPGRSPTVDVEVDG